MIRLAAEAFNKPDMDWKALSPLVAVIGGSTLVMLVGLLRGQFVQRLLVPVLAIASLGAAIGLAVWTWEVGDTGPIVAGAFAVDTLTLGITVICCAAGILAILLSWPTRASRSSFAHSPGTDIGAGDRVARLHARGARDGGAAGRGDRGARGVPELRRGSQ